MRKPRMYAHRLSPRQVECLEWAAQGKTIIEISMILGISLASVKSYLDAARYRLNAVNVTHAVAIATAGRLIDTEPLGAWLEATASPVSISPPIAPVPPSNGEIDWVGRRLSDGTVLFEGRGSRFPETEAPK